MKLAIALAASAARPRRGGRWLILDSRWASRAQHGSRRRGSQQVVLASAVALLGACSGSNSGPTEIIANPLAAEVVVLSGGGASDSIGSTMNPVEVQVVDSAGTPLASTAVRFHSSIAGGRVMLLASPSPAGPFSSIASAVTDAEGVATAHVRFGTRAGPATLTAMELATGASATIEFEVEPGAPVRIDLTAHRTLAIVGDTVEIRAVGFDRAENVVGLPIPVTSSGPVELSEHHLVGTDFGNAILVASVGGLSDTLDVRILPSGYIVYGSINHIFRSRLDASERSTLELSTGLVDAAPVGSLAVVVSQNRLHYASFDGSTTRVTPTSIETTVRQEQWPKHTWDGQWIYFMALVPGSGSDWVWSVWRVRPDGRDAEPVTHPTDPSLSHRYPAPSSDGGRVVYVEGESPGPLVLRDVESGATTPLGVWGYTSRWSPDDEWIAYVDSLNHLRRVRPNGSDDREIVHVPSTFRLPFGWSPDGRFLIAASSDGPQLVVIETGNLVRLELDTSVFSASWHGGS